MKKKHNLTDEFFLHRICVLNYALKKNFKTLYRTLEAASEKYNQKESSYIDDIQKLEDNLADVIFLLIIKKKQI